MRKEGKKKEKGKGIFSTGKMPKAVRLAAALIAAIVVFTSTVAGAAAVPYSAGSYDKSVQWSLDMIDADIAYHANLIGQGVRVAVIDSGVTLHSDLSRIIERKNYLEGETSLDDSVNHGTIVAGIISADDDNTGILGVAPGASLISLKCFGSKKTDYNYVVKAIYDAVDVYDCDIINLSMGISSDKENFKTAVEYALSKGVVVVAACGNGNSADYFYPASYDGVLSVSAVNKEGVVSSQTQHNDQVSLAAPGMNVYSTTSNGSYGSKSGSSFAVPFVSGAAAVLLSLDRTLTPQGIYDILTQTATDTGDTGYDEYYGYGILNLGNAVRKVIADKKCTVSPIENETGEDGGLSTVVYNNTSETFSGVCRLGREEQAVTIESGCAEKLTFTDYAPYGTEGNSVQVECAVYEKAAAQGQSGECVSNARECTVKEIAGKSEGEGDGSETDGDKTDGDNTDDKTDGNTDGDKTDGKTDGDNADDKTDGKTDGSKTDGDNTDGNTDGDKTDGNTDGNKTDGNTDGDTTDGKTDSEKSAAVFFDVTAGDWFYNDLNGIYRIGLMNGVSENIFAPSGTVTRAMVVTVLYRMSNEASTMSEVASEKTSLSSGLSDMPFEDVAAGSWYAEAVAWGAQKGIVNGISESSFAPDRAITRQEMATLVYRFMNYAENASLNGEDEAGDLLDLYDEAGDLLDSYADSGDVALWAQSATAFCLQKGILNGVEDENGVKSLYPGRGLKRSEMAAITARICRQLGIL